MFLEANGLRFCADVRGDGPNMLFIGGTGWDLRVEPNPLCSVLTRHFCVALFDQRGMGRSDKPQGPYSMADYAADAVGILDALGWDRAHVVGYSFGGMVAQEMVLLAPDRVDRLVLAATSPGGRGGASFAVETLLPLPPFERALRGLEVADLRFTVAFQADNPEKSRDMVERRMRAQTRFIDEPGARQGLEAQLAARACHDTADRLHRITAPTLILAGAHDGQASKDGQAFMLEAIPDAMFRSLEGSHNFIFESAACYEAIVAFCLPARDADAVKPPARGMSSSERDKRP